MDFSARRAAACAALAACLAAPCAPAWGQAPRPGHPTLSGTLGRPTPTPTSTPTATATPTVTASPTATATATASPGSSRRPLPNTGGDPGLVALAGTSLLGFGIALRLRLRLDDGLA